MIMTKFSKTHCGLIITILLSCSILAILAIYASKQKSPAFDISDISRNFQSKPGLLLVGDELIKQGPLMFFIDPNDLSIDKVNLNKSPNIDFAGIHEVRPFMLDNKYKLAMGTHHPGKVLILSDDGASWDSLEIEFEEELDEFVRAVFVGDIDSDGKEEIVVGTRPNGILKYYKFADGQWSGTIIDKINVTIHDLLITDWDSNGLNEIIITTSIPFHYTTEDKVLEYKPKILKYEFDRNQNKWKKEVVWEFTKIVSNLNPKGDSEKDLTVYEHARYLFFADFYEDGAKEMVANIPDSGSLKVFKLDGIDYSQEMIEDRLMLSDSIITVGDIDNDGKSEIITSTWADDALLLYKYEEGKWKRSVLAEGLADKMVMAVTILDCPGEKYKKILYVAISSGTTRFYVLEYEPLEDAWGKELVAELKIEINVWGIFPAFP